MSFGVGLLYIRTRRFAIVFHIVDDKAWKGWLLIETASVSVDTPLIATIPPNDGLNTVGTVFIGAMVVAVFVLARIERAALAGPFSALAFTTTILALAGCVHCASERAARARNPARREVHCSPRLDLFHFERPLKKVGTGWGDLRQVFSDE